MIEDKLTQEQRIRLECLAQANATMVHVSDADSVIVRAKKFEAYVKGPSMKWANDVGATDGAIYDRPGGHPGHNPVQHRDGKVPWCNACGLDVGYNTPVRKLWAAGLDPACSGEYGCNRRSTHKHGADCNVACTMCYTDTDPETEKPHEEANITRGSD